ncbi:tetratricopeptide repeat domain-containing protein [Penicillium sp. CMV-2018d]|nr:tetratricopeptide repeat domain-containing protein [Penicillium sp. CMV-2018d]
MSTRKLRPVHPKDAGLEAGNVDFILIPGVGTPPVEDWSILSQEWMSFFDATESQVNFLAYDYQINLDNSFTLRALLDEGHNLLAALHEYQQNNVRPIIFISHSLGSFLVKQALCVANAQKHYYLQVLNSVQAVVFLGAPHLPSDPLRLAEQYTLILRSISNSISKQTFTRIANDSWLLSDTSRIFDDIELQVEVLSLYETNETRVRVGVRDGKGLFNPYRSFILTGSEVTLTGAIREKHFALSGTHFELPRLQQFDGLPHHAVREWLSFVLSKNFRETVEPLSDSNYDPQKSHSGGADATAGSSTGKEWQILPILNGFVTQRRFAKLPCFMLDTPVRNDAFYGRKSIIKNLDECLLPPTKTTLFSQDEMYQRHVVLCGTGGIGKTSIAIEYVFSRRERFDAIFWIRSDEPSKLEQDFGRIAIELGLQDANEPFNPVICRELAKGWLENPTKVLDQENDIISQVDIRWLIVFDNADSPGLLQDYWPLSYNGSILVTSRDPLSKNSPSIASKSIDVAPLDDIEAAELLQRLSCVTKDVDFSIKIARKLGGLPLAISQMAAVIRYQYLSFPELYEWYEDGTGRGDLLTLDAVSPRPEARGNIASIWAIEQLGPHAACLLEICTMLDPDCIQERLFASNLGEVGCLEHFPTTTLTYLAARADLIRRSLIAHNPENRQFRVHRVLQDSVLSKMSLSRMLRVFSFAVNLVLAAWGDTPLAQRHVISLARARDGLFPHALVLKRMYEKNYRGKSHEFSMQLAKLMNEAGWYQHERGNSEDIKPFFNLALEICRQTSDSRSSEVLADIHYGLGAVANETNDGKSCLYHNEQLLKLRHDVFSSTGKGDIRLANAHNQFGIALVMNREYEKAIYAFETSIGVYRGLEDYWLSMDHNPRTNMGFTYWIIGNLDRAEQILRDLLHDRETKFGVNDRESFRTGRVYHGLGNILYDRGLFEESENWHHRALSHYQATIGNIHHKTADLCHRVAQHCLRRGEMDYARTLIDQALKVYGLRQSVFLPELARTTFLKAHLATHLGEVLEATDLFNKAKEMRSQIPHAPLKPDASLKEADFDELVTFWSR